jgi:hypothetical protein
MLWFVEMTDTYGGEANYCWANRFKVRASTPTGAIRKVAKETGYSGRVHKVMDCGDLIRHDVRRAAICYFTQPWSEYDAEYLRVVEL